MVYPETPEPWSTKAFQMYEMARITFEAEIGRHRASGRPLYGKLRALEGVRAFQTKGGAKHVVTDDEVEKTKAAFCQAWGNADYTMSMDELWPAENGAGDNRPYPCPGKALPKRPADPPAGCTLPPPG